VTLRCARELGLPLDELLGDRVRVSHRGDRGDEVVDLGSDLGCLFLELADRGVRSFGAFTKASANFFQHVDHDLFAKHVLADPFGHGCVDGLSRTAQGVGTNRAATLADFSTEVIVHSDPKQAIIDAAKATSPDLVVIGVSGHNAWERMMLGSTATRILSEVPRPVLVVPFNAVTASGLPH
jgi:hypothetical protein